MSKETPVSQLRFPALVIISVALSCLLVWPPEVKPVGSEPAPTPTPVTASPARRQAREFANSVGMSFVLVPAGSFMMGANNGQANERPVHQVTIGYAFYMGRYEVTQAQWQRVMGTSVRQQRDRGQVLPQFRGIVGKGDNYPMYYVSWEDAQAFVNALNARNDGYQYRLPSEAEWEYACRAGTTGDYAGVLDAIAWYGNNSGRQYLDADAIWRTDQSNYASRLLNNGNQTHPVGTKQPNAWGLYDMHGNVWEWVLDYYHDSYNGAPTDSSAWLSGGDSRHRVLRGGSWLFNAPDLRSSYRYWVRPVYRSNNHGFRLVAVARQ
jgi:formylglycine-generating enzyme required for sulfatase activity